MKKIIINSLVIGTALFASRAAFADIAVNQFNTISGPTTVDTWYINDVRPGGTATIRDLSGLGGNLESNQPLPTGAARLTTLNDNPSKAEVYTFDNYGSAASVLNNIQLSYSYYKTANGVESAAAPALKLNVYNAAGTGTGDNDSFGSLVFEPYWNNGGAAVSDQWTTLSIDQNTGEKGTGGWWWNGGFGLSNGVGGPPLHSLAEWNLLFATANDPDYAGASITGLGVGVGTYNPAQDDYFDGVSITTGSAAPITKKYDFQAGGTSSVPDIGSTIALLSMSFAGMVGFGVRNRKAKK